MSRSWFAQRLVTGIVLTVVVVGLEVSPPRCFAEELHLTHTMLADYATRYLQSPKEPTERDSVFWAIAYLVPGEKEGSRFVTLESDHGSVLLLFTSPIRLILYANAAADIPAPYRVACWSPVRCLDRLREIRERSHVELFSLDRTPGCLRTTTFAIRDLDSFRDLAQIWELNRGVAIQCGHKYYPGALAAAERGDFSASLDTVSQLVQCVVPEEPRLYILMGAAGIAHEDQALVDFAINTLRWLEPEVGERLAFEARTALRLPQRERRAAAARAVRMVSDVKVTILRE